MIFPGLLKKRSLGLTVLAAFCLGNLSACAFKNIVNGRRDPNGGGAGPGNLAVPEPAGMGLLDGSGDLQKATAPIVAMTSCNGQQQGVMPARLIRLTMAQLYESLQFHSGAPLKKAEFVELPRSTTNFAENSYALHGDETFTQLAGVQARKAAAGMDLTKVITCAAAAFSGDTACQDQFIKGFASRVLRQPLEGNDAGASLKSLMGTLLAAEAGEKGLRLLIETLFQHPLFLYRQEIGKGQDGNLDSYELATLVAFTLTDRPPDDQLWQAAQSSLSIQNLAQHIQRLIGNQEAAASLRSRFFAGYLQLNDAQEMQKNHINLADAQGQEQSFRDYIANTPLDRIFAAVSDAGDGRIGIHTHRFYLMNQSVSASEVSDIHAGVSLRKNILCQKITPPPSNNLGTGSGADGIQARAQSNSCSGCHQYIDPIGQNYLSFDGVGVSKGAEGGKSSVITATLDFDDTYDSMEQLSEALAASDHARRCLALQSYRFLLGRPELPGEECHVNFIYNAIASSGSARFEDVVTAALAYQGNAKRK